ncbi:ABC transporter substrate-binding protein [Bradyrhizobium sp. CNPSo 4010]|uniref:ABC transporter substrate-binding protein n=1 Tax=Bradyrhizobium agreste TaxID=2751811 RepID=A0ABS0PW78_9BRAD|nr:ABC transporter substrate-binding protein [Bradyrhizobium agreste]MBH5401457.1 ABC transporter substrate-binding protein [Bradyrhizobium agreste]
MKRREFVTLVCSLVAAWPLVGRAQPKPHRIGILATTSAATTRSALSAFLEGMSQFGYALGSNIELVERYADGEIADLPVLASELIAAKVDVMVVSSRPAIAAAQRATKDIPIVMTAVGDPVEAGFVASLARPGGSITGLSNIAPELSGKRLEILKEVIPDLKRVAIVRNPSIATFAPMWQETERVAASLGITAVPVDIVDPAGIEPAFASMVKNQVQAAVFLSDAVTASQAPRITGLAAKERLPVMYPLNEFMKAGGLLMYGPDSIDLWRRGAYFVDRIIKGTSPADLPVQQPTRFELIVNLRTAKALGLSIPSTLLARADEVIE